MALVGITECLAACPSEIQESVRQCSVQEADPFLYSLVEVGGAEQGLQEDPFSSGPQDCPSAVKSVPCVL